MPQLRHILSIYQKELKRYFVSPIGGVLLAGSALLFALTVYGGDSLR